MKKITKDGKHFVQIAETRWEEVEGKNGARNYMTLVIVGQNSNEEQAEGRIFFNTELCQGGKFQGKPRIQESMQKCIDLGMSAPFSPTKTGPMPYDPNADELYGKTCEFVMETKEKYGCQVKYINTAHREPLSQSRVAELWNELAGEAATTTPPAQTTPKPADPLAEAEDDLPFK
jgi:hypothetical protein